MDVALSDAKAKLTALVKAAELGERVVLTRHGKPVARIVRERHWRDMTPDERVATLKAAVAAVPHRPSGDPRSAREIQNELDDDIWESHDLS